MFITSLRIVLLILLAALFSKIILMALNPHQLPFLLSTDGIYALWWGLRLDLTTVAALATPIVLLMLAIGFKSKIIRPLVFLAIAWIILTTTADAIYMIEAGRHVTFEVFTGTDLEDGLIATAFTSFLSQTLTGLGLLLLFGLVLWFTPFQETKKMNLRHSGIFLLLWILFATTAIRGGWFDAPQSPMSAYKIGEPNQAAIAWSAPYSITYHLSKGQKNAAQKKTFPATIEDIKLLASLPFNKGEFVVPAKQANVLVILLESWNSYDMYSYAKEAEATPFFNSLQKKSLSPERFYADGYRTVEGMFATFCSFPNPIGGGVAGTQLQAAKYQCLPQLLKEQGWDTRLVQGSGKGIVGAFAQSIGFTESYGKTDFEFEGTKNYWGYMDDDIYRFTLDTLHGMSAPYLVAINTGTTHDEYLPDESDYIFGKENRKDMQRAVLHHADNSLKRFLEKLPEVLKEPTLVVLVADHTAGTAPEGLQRNAIPFLMFATDGSLPLKQLPISAGQLDIAPTIIDWLGGNIPWFTGQSLLQDEYTGFAHYSSGQSMNWIKGRHLVRFDVTLDIHNNNKTECYKIADNGIDLTAQNCEDAHYQTMLQEAQAYTRYTQGLLFAGKSSEFGKDF
ncbi:MAG: LTA synthase family protein [Sulfurimonadaceae bacterium]|jgi:phosphoglycerol transferase MdoB-like AlkP superfamily enzyme|nr:LTA synthase family protein [Sulfurimonadaceae bacterium]